MPSQFGGIAIDNPATGSQFGGVPVEEPHAAPAQPVSPWGDVAKSLVGGIEQGAAALPMVLPNLINQAVAGPQLLGIGIKDTIEGNPTTKNPHLWQPFYSSQDVLNQLPEALQPHQPQTIAGVGGNIFGQLLGNIGAGKAIQSGYEKVIAPETPSPQEIKAASGNAYQQMRDAGATLNQKGINTVTYGVGKALSDSGMMNPALHGDTMSIVQAMNDDAASGGMDLEKLDQYRQLLNQVVSKNTTKLEGMNPDAYKAQTAINALDDAVDSLGQQHLSNGSPQAIESLNNARTLYAAQARMNTMQRIVDNAQYSDNPATAIKTGFKNLAKSLAVNPRGYSPEEIDAINNAAKTGIVTGALKLAGSRLAPLIMGGAGYATGGPIGGAVAGAGDYMLSGAARTAANALQAGRANNAIEMVGQRPEVQAAMGIKPPAPLPSLAAPIAASMNTTNIPKPATGNIGDQNMQELQKVQQALPPQSNAAPQTPNVQSFAKAESSGNPNAKNPNSTASGLYQFTNRTWADMVRRYGKQTGINLGDKNNPQAQATMASLYAKDNIKAMEPILGRLPNKAELYMAHVFGAQGASKLITAPKNQEAIMLFPRPVIDANHSLFFNKGQPRTVGQVEQLLAEKVA